MPSGWQRQCGHLSAPPAALARAFQAPCLQKYVQRCAALQATHTRAGAASAATPRSSSTQRCPMLRATRFIALLLSSSVNNTQAHPAQLLQGRTQNHQRNTLGIHRRRACCSPAQRRQAPAAAAATAPTATSTHALIHPWGSGTKEPHVLKHNSCCLDETFHMMSLAPW